MTKRRSLFWAPPSVRVRHASRGAEAVHVATRRATWTRLPIVLVMKNSDGLRPLASAPGCPGHAPRFRLCTDHAARAGAVSDFPRARADLVRSTVCAPVCTCPRPGGTCAPLCTVHNVSHTAVYALCTPFRTCPGGASAIFAGKQLDPLLVLGHVIGWGNVSQGRSWRLPA